MSLMTKTYEHMTHSCSGIIPAERLDEFGDAGWEMCGVVQWDRSLSAITYLYYFKRSAEAKAEWETTFGRRGA